MKGSALLLKGKRHGVEEDVLIGEEELEFLDRCFIEVYARGVVNRTNVSGSTSYSSLINIRDASFKAAIVALLERRRLVEEISSDVA